MIPEKMRFNLTNICNQRCVFCFHDPKRDHQNMDFNKFKRAVIFLGKNNCQRIEFLGGEPLLYPFFKEAFIFAQSQVKEVVVFSNGTIKIPTTIKPRALDRIIFNFAFFRDQSFVKNLRTASAIFPNFGFNITLPLGCDLKEIKKGVVFLIKALDKLNNFEKHYGFRISFDSMANIIHHQKELASKFCDLALFLEKRKVLTKDWGRVFPPCFMDRSLKMIFKKKIKGDFKSICALQSAGSLDVNFNIGFCEIFPTRFGNLFGKDGRIINIHELRKILIKSYQKKLSIKKNNLCSGCEHYLKNCDGLCWPNATKP